MNKKILVAGFFVSVMLLVPINSAYSNTGIQIEKKPIIKTNPAKPLGVTFMKTYGGTNEDIGHCVQQTTDGGYIISGSTESFGAGSDDVWLIKTDSDGNWMWDKTFGGSDVDWSSSVQQTTDGGYILTGVTASFGDDYGDVWLIKTDSDGNESWNRTYGGTDYGGVGYSVQQTTDGGYIITGIKSSIETEEFYVLLIKTDSDGNESWNKTFGGTTDALYAGSCVRQTTDGGYIITGEKQTSDAGYVDVWLIKTDSDGNKTWDKTFGGTHNDLGMCVQQTSDGGYIITGYTELYLSGDIWLIKTDSNGNEIWAKSYGIILNAGWGNWVQQTTDGGYIITGFAWEINGDNTDAWLIKTDSNGKKIWDRKLGGTSEDMGDCVQQTTDGGYIISGRTWSYGNGECDVWLVKTDKYGRPRNKAINKPTSNFLQSHLNPVPIFTKTITGFFNMIQAQHQNHMIYNENPNWCYRFKYPLSDYNIVLGR